MCGRLGVTHNATKKKMIKFATHDLDQLSFDNLIVHMYYSNFKNIVVDAHSVASFDYVVEPAHNGQVGRVLIQN
jgi:hypothetical protein